MLMPSAIPMRRVALALFVAACAEPPAEEPAGDSSPVPPALPVTPALAPPPWRDPRLPRDSIPAVYYTQWQKAENRASCALIAPESLGDGVGATPRAANFSGGWAVAYDRPGVRSAFGIAGSGSNASDDAYVAWPHTTTWADSSSAGYGPEGGSGPNQLAFLRISGQECLYNVWSRLGVEHLEFLLSQLRFVE